MLITRGRVRALRLFDIADEVDLAQAAQLVRDLSRRPKFVGSARYIRLPVPPLEMALGPRDSGLPGMASADVFVRLYDVGALAVTFVHELPAPMEPEALVALASRVLENEENITAAARHVAEEIFASIRGACKLGRLADLTEDYTIFQIVATEPVGDADGLLKSLDVARLLIGERGPLAPSERSYLQRSRATFSYRPDDLVVIDWSMALTYDPSDESEVADLLEFVTMQLLELRAYDDLVARSLDGLYEELGNDRWVSRLSSKYVRLSRRLMRVFVEVTEMSERIDNALQFLGDSWLARVHRAAIEEFAIFRWERQLKDKLDVLRQINEFLVDQVGTNKGLRLELAIVVLILVEILFALFEVI